MYLLTDPDCSFDRHEIFRINNSADVAAKRTDILKNIQVEVYVILSFLEIVYFDEDFYKNEINRLVELTSRRRWAKLLFHF